MGLKNADEIWVQTITMKKRLLNFLKKKIFQKKITIKIMPLIDEENKEDYDPKKRFSF